MMNGLNDGSGAWLTFGLLVAVASVAVLVWAVGAAGPRRRALPGSSDPVRSAALAELDLRYARGEMDREQYVARRAEVRTGLVADRDAGL